MKDCTYYDLLGLPLDAAPQEITDAKNFLVKKLHPDANMKELFDTTTYIQSVLEAYHMLSNPNTRKAYDRRIANPFRRNDDSDDVHTYATGPLTPNFAPYWQAANKLNELIGEGIPLIRKKKRDKTDETAKQLNQLIDEALIHAQVLEDGEIPRAYWHPHAMNWLLFEWSKNRDLPYLLLYTMYDSFLEQYKTNLERKKLAHQNSAFLANLDKLLAAKTVSQNT